MARFKYSTQAQNLINNISDFNLEEFEDFFEKRRIVGGGDVLDFLDYKQSQGGN